MQDRRETEADLIFDVQMALRGAPFRKDADKSWVAKQIVAHLKMCGWLWRRKEPKELHGTSQPADDNAKTLPRNPKGEP
ncbi:MAG: hypothetical protein AB7S74_16130 [Hyphomicrobium sp.]